MDNAINAFPFVSLPLYFEQQLSQRLCTDFVDEPEVFGLFNHVKKTRDHLNAWVFACVNCVSIILWPFHKKLSAYFNLSSG